MVLKSYRLKDFVKKRMKLKKGKGKLKPLKDIATAGVTAIIGVAFLSETARAVSRV